MTTTRHVRDRLRAAINDLDADQSNGYITVDATDLFAVLAALDAYDPPRDPNLTNRPCPECGAPIRTLWSGVKCSAKCGWWYCA